MMLVAPVSPMVLMELTDTGLVATCFCFVTKKENGVGGVRVEEESFLFTV